MSFVKERLFPAASPAPIDEEASEMSLMGESFSVLIGVEAEAGGAEGDTRELVLMMEGEEEEGAMGASSWTDVF